MADTIQLVLEFHQSMGVPYHYTPTIPTDDRALLRIKLMQEETDELHYAILKKDIVEIVDGLVDCMYIILGTAHEYGVANLLPKAFEEIHRTNMAKLTDGVAIKNEFGKIMKPEGWQPPNLLTIIQEYSQSY